jgi:hypothetical protein
VTQEHHYTGERNEVRRQAMEDAILLLENCIRETPVCSE